MVTKRQPYASALQASKMLLIEPLIPAAKPEGFVILPRCWIVVPLGYPTFGWFAYFRRLRKE